MMKKRFLYIALICLSPLLGWAQDFEQMVADMSDKSLPLINVEVDIDSVNSEYFLPGRITLNEYKNNAVVTTSYDCQVRHRGMLALVLPKKSFAIKLVDENGEKLDANLLNLRTDNTWILDAMGYDKLRMRNRVCFDIWNEYSHTMWDTNFGKRNGTVGTMVEVFINGQYNGIYCLSDKINRQLLNLRKAKVKDDGSVTVKGLLYKGISNSTSNHLDTYIEANTDTVAWNSFELQYPDEYPSIDTWQPLMNLIDFNTTPNEYFIEHYNEWYYVDNLVDYWILLVAFGLKDMPYKNTFLSTPDINFEHRFMISPWDLDACLGRNWIGASYPEPSSLKYLDEFAPFNRFLKLDIDGFKNKVAQRWFQLVESHLSLANVENHINSIKQQFTQSGAWQREYQRWQLYDFFNVSDNIDEEVQYVLTWYSANLQHISVHIDPWRDDYDPNVIISSSTVTHIYNYILGYDETFYEWLDLNNDGYINTSDVTKAYNVLLGI